MQTRYAALFALAVALAGCRTSRTDDEKRWDKLHPPEDPAAAAGTERGFEAEAAYQEEGARAAAVLSDTDRDFAEQAASGGHFEVESSRLALQKGVGGELREFADMMVGDHTRANRELEDLAGRKGLALPSRMEPEHQRKLDELRDRQGKEFERAYRDAQFAAHDEAIDLFEEAARECKDLDLKSLAERTLPTLRRHRDALDDLEL